MKLALSFFRHIHFDAGWILAKASLHWILWYKLFVQTNEFSFFIIEMNLPARNRHSTSAIRLFCRLRRQSAIFLLAQKIIWKCHSCWIVVLGKAKKESNYNRKKTNENTPNFILHSAQYYISRCLSVLVIWLKLLYSARWKQKQFVCLVFVWFFASWIKKWIKHIHTHYDCTPMHLSTLKLMYKLIFGMAVDETLKWFAECWRFFRLGQKKCSTQVRICALHLFTREQLINCL